MASWFDPLPISAPKQGSKWSAELSIAPSDKIVKPSRRQQCACDWCRYSKKRCDGRSPCKRCQSAKRKCVYTPLQGKQKTITSPSYSYSSPSPVSSPEEMDPPNDDHSPPRTSPTLHLEPTLGSPTETLAKNYLGLFFSRMYTAGRLLPNFTLSRFDQTNNRSVLLQVYSAAANASRAYGGSTGSSLYRSFEDRAHQLARELFDDISPQTAFGFHLLSYHTRGHDILKSNHYRDLANSMCDQLLRSRNASQQARDYVLRLKLINYHVRDYNDPGPALGADSEAYAASATAMKLLEVNRFKARFRVILSNVVQDSESCELIPHSLSPAQCQEACDLVSSVMDWVRSSQLITPQHEEVARAFSSMLETVVLFAGGRENDAVNLLHRAMDVMELNMHMLYASDFSIMECLHLCFLVAYTARDVRLMRKIQNFRDPFAAVLPSTRDQFEQDAQRLENYINSQKAGPARPPISSAPPFSVAPSSLRESHPHHPVSAPPPPRCAQPLFAPSNTRTFQEGNIRPRVEHPSPFSFFPSTSPYGEPHNFTLSGSSDQVPFSVEDFIDSIGNEPYYNKNSFAL